MLGEKARRIKGLEDQVEDLERKLQAESSRSTRFGEELESLQRLPHMLQSAELKAALSLDANLQQGIMNFWSDHEGRYGRTTQGYSGKIMGDFPESAAYVPMLVQRSYTDLIKAIILGDETAKAAMIENLRNISAVLKNYRGFDLVLGLIEKNFGKVHLDQKLVSKERIAWDEVYQKIIKRIEDETQRGGQPGYRLWPYYFVGVTDNKVHRAG